MNLPIMPLKFKVLFGLISSVVLFFVINVLLHTFVVPSTPGFNKSSDKPQPKIPSQEGPTSSSGANNTPTKNCPKFDYLLSQIEYYTPTWDEVGCFTNGLERKPIPSFAKRVLADPDGAFDTRANLGQLYQQLWSTLSANIDMNVTPVEKAPLPPYTDESRQPLTYPLSGKDHDRAMRVAALVLINEKKTGKLAFLRNVSPPFAIAPVFKTPAEFKDWNKNIFLPTKVVEAKTAEFIKAEYYEPFPTEAEMFFNKTAQPGLNKLPPKELLALAQDWINDIRDTVKPLFKGRLMAHSAAVRYHVLGDVWKDVSFKGYDELEFTLIPECDLTTTANYFKSNLTEYPKLAAKDNLPWSIGEVDILPTHYKLCDTNFDQIELDLYKELFRQLDAMSSKTVGLHINIPKSRLNPDSVQSKRLWAFIDQYFKTH